MAGGWRSGRERKFHACPAGADAAFALARGTVSQPRVPPSATHAAPPAAACRNLFRVTLGVKSVPLSQAASSPISLKLRKVRHSWSLLGLYRTAAGHLSQREVPGHLSYDEVHEPARYVDALAKLFAL